MTRAEALLRTVAGQFPTFARKLGIRLLRKPLPAAAPDHFHYCTACDRQWSHSGASWSCTRPWASGCPRCRPNGVKPSGAVQPARPEGLRRREGERK